MSIGLVDWAGLGLPKLDYIFGPTPVISTVASERTAYETHFVNEALSQADWVNNNPNEPSILFQHGQYGGHRTLYRLFYSTQQIYPQLKTAADRLIQVYRDGLLGWDPNWWDVTLMQQYLADVPGSANNVINTYHNPNGEGFAAYSLINPSLEAAATRKTADIVKYYAATGCKFHGLIQPTSLNPEHAGGARESGVAIRWAFLFYILWGPTATVSITVNGVTRPWTAAEILEDALQCMMVVHTPPNRPNFGWDFGTAPPFASEPGFHNKLYIGNMNLAGSASQGYARIDRYFKKQGTPDSRIWPQIRTHVVWTERGFVPLLGQITSNPGTAIDTGGTQHVPGVGPYDAFGIPRWKGTWRYYYHHDPRNYGRSDFNGIHGDTETVNGGHLLSTLAWAYAQETDPASKAEWRSACLAAIDGMYRFVTDNIGPLPHYWDPRNWTEWCDTWQEAYGLLEEADGQGPPPPPLQDMDVTPLDPVVNAQVTVVITGGPANVADWVAIAPIGSPLTSYLDWKYLSNNSQAFPSSGVAAGTVTLTAPAAANTYEVRFLLNDGFTLVPGYTPVQILVSGGSPGFQATITQVGADPDQPYSVEVAVSPQDEYVVRFFVNDVPYPTPITGPLTKGTGQRFFKNPNGRAVFLTGSHNWNSVSEWGLAPGNPGNPPPVFDWSAFMLHLQNHGHTATRLWLLGDFVGSSSANARVLFPWARSTTPGSINGGNKYDLTQFDPVYFARLRDRVVEAAAAGITCIVVFFNGWDDQFGTAKNIWHASENITIDGDPNANGQTEETYNLATQPAGMLNIQKAYIHKVVDTLNDLDNVVWEPVNEGGGFSQTWHETIIADLRAYEASKPKQHPILGSYLYSGGTNAQLWNFNVEAVAPGPLAGAGTSPDGGTDYTNDPPASSGVKVVVLDTDHIYGVGGDENDVWRNFCRAIQTIYMDPLIDQEPFPLPWNGNPPNAAYQRARNAMGITAQMRDRLRTDLNGLVPQAQGTATPCNTGYALYAPVVFAPGGFPIEGFGANTTGGAGLTVVHVTNLNDSGAGSLRAACSAGNRTIVFDVSGTITLLDRIEITGLANMTIDGLTSPSGITVRDWGINIFDSSNIIVRHLRVRDMNDEHDSIGIVGNCENIVIDHCSMINQAFSGGVAVEVGDGGCDVKAGARNVTVQWCLLGVGKQMLVGSTGGDPDPDTRRVSVHHNAFIGVIDTAGILGTPNAGYTTRTPLLRRATNATELTCDFRENIVAFALRANNAKAEVNTWSNMVGNAFIPAPATTTNDRADSIERDGGNERLYTSGNVELGTPALGVDLNDVGNETSPFAAPPVASRPLTDVFNNCGPGFTRDADEQARLDLIAPFSPFT